MFAGVGERTREGNDLYKEMTESVSAESDFDCWHHQSYSTDYTVVLKLSALKQFSGVQGVIKLGEKASESKCTLVYGQMNEPPGARARVALTGGS